MGLKDDEREALDALFTLTYDELKRRARKLKVGDRSATLTPTALVNEAWERLRRASAFATTSELHFKNLAALAMERILVEAARRRTRLKNNEGVPFVTFDESLAKARGLSAEEVLVLQRALDELERRSARQAQIVRLRCFVGLGMEEIADVLEVHVSSVERDWRVAHAFLRGRLADQSSAPPEAP